MRYLTLLLFVFCSSVQAVPLLHSYPGGKAILYLDFLGDPNDRATPAYDIDGNPASFSTQENANIQAIWARVAEKFSPFNMDVTTEPPAIGISVPNKVQKQLIGGSGAWHPNSGGATNRAAFWDGDTSYVFPNNLGSVLTIAECSAHEAGHAFGLSHHSTYVNGIKTATYDPGNALVAPIMGVTYYSERGLWAIGPDDTGVNTVQDDLAVISGPIWDFGYRPQDHGQDIAHADTLTGTAIGVIATTSDHDTFSFNWAGGTANLKMDVAADGPMLHAKLDLLSDSASIIATAANANTLSQDMNVDLPVGVYYAVAESYGAYGDLGQYTLSVQSVPECSYAFMGLLLFFGRRLRLSK